MDVIPPGRVVDPGLQPERTGMAWGRTSLAFMVAAAVFLRSTASYGPPVVAVAGGLFAVALGAALAQKRRYRRAAEGVARERVPAPVGAVVALSLGTVALGSAGLLFAVAGH
ncbi:DUF202 domain-containing protein [Corynebacterium provencense]|nr:DUF202 domain-containing protein [Corynebacterium provencense]